MYGDDHFSILAIVSCVRRLPFATLCSPHWEKRAWRGVGECVRVISHNVSAIGDCWLFLSSVLRGFSHEHCCGCVWLFFLYLCSF